MLFICFNEYGQYLDGYFLFLTNFFERRQPPDLFPDLF